MSQSKEWAKCFALIDAENRKRGRCLKCGGSGVVANLRSSDPYANRRCQRCKGTGKIHPNDVAEPQP